MEYVTRSGRRLTDADIERLSEEAERGYDIAHLLGLAPEPVEAVRARLARLIGLEPLTREEIAVLAGVAGHALDESHDALHAYLCSILGEEEDDERERELTELLGAALTKLQAHYEASATTADRLADALVAATGVDNPDAERELARTAAAICENIADGETDVDSYVARIAADWFSENPGAEVRDQLAAAIRAAIAEERVVH